MTLNLPNKIDFISRVCPKYTGREGLEKKDEITISVSFSALFIKQIKAFEVACHLLVLKWAFAMVWMQLEESGATCTQRSRAGPVCHHLW